MARVIFDHVTKRYGEIVAINDLDLIVSDRDFLVFIGPSGCGKTTILRCLAGLEKVSDGKILIDEQVVNDVPVRDRDVAMVFQSYALYPHMTVFDNIAFGLKIRKTPPDEIEKRIAESGELMDIEGFLEKIPRELSAGQQQAAAVGRTIARVPKVFLFDEPLSNLDARRRSKTRGDLIKLHQQLETTFVYVTNDQAEAMTLATRIGVLNHGVLQQCDTPRKIYDQPRNLFVAGFIGSPAMNIINARLIQEEGSILVDAGSFVLELPINSAGKYEGYIGKKVILGIRPEDIFSHETLMPTSPVQLVDAQLDNAEFLGNETLLHLISGEHEFVSRVRTRSTVKRGEVIQIAFDLERIHLFDPQTELAVR